MHAHAIALGELIISARQRAKQGDMFFSQIDPLIRERAASATFNLPNRPDSLKFFVLGDFGDGGKEQYELAAQMAKVHAVFPALFIITVGDNIYGSEGPKGFSRKFEIPYKPLLDAGVKFQAWLGNHDARAGALRAVQHGPARQGLQR